MKARNRTSITAWPSPEKKARFAALATSRGLSESKLLGLLVDTVLARNPIEAAVETHRGQRGKGDHISVRLRPGDGKLLRLRAQARGMKYTTYAAVVIRAHLRVHPPMPLGELAKLERSLSMVSVIAGSLGQIARVLREGEGVEYGRRLEVAAIVPAVEQLWQQMREVVKANVISWESADVEAS